MVTITASVQHCPESPGQFNKTGKINKWYKNHKEAISSFADDITV